LLQNKRLEAAEEFVRFRLAFTGNSKLLVKEQDKSREYLNSLSLTERKAAEPSPVGKTLTLKEIIKSHEDSP
jgi:hypothetical protein